jgi:hypothetical protein
MDEDRKSALPPHPVSARLKPGLWARMHYLAWSLIYILLYPVSWLVRLLEKRREYD